MPDLFVGGAAPALGHVAWVENAFAPAVKADASYLRTAIDALSKLSATFRLTSNRWFFSKKMK